MNNMKGNKTHARASLAPSLVSKMVRVGRFSPHDATFDGAVGGTDRLGVRDGSLHPGDLRVPSRRVNSREIYRRRTGKFTSSRRCDCRAEPRRLDDPRDKSDASVRRKCTRRKGRIMAYEVVDARSNYETLSSTGKAVVHGNDVARL